MFIIIIIIVMQTLKKKNNTQMHRSTKFQEAHLQSWSFIPSFDTLSYSYSFKPFQHGPTYRPALFVVLGLLARHRTRRHWTVSRPFRRRRGQLDGSAGELHSNRAQFFHNDIVITWIACMSCNLSRLAALNISLAKLCEASRAERPLPLSRRRIVRERSEI